MTEKTAKRMRERSANFTNAEIRLLFGIVSHHIQIVEARKYDSKTITEKEKTWADIAREFNVAPPSVRRSRRTLKQKYESLKKMLRKKLKTNSEATNQASRVQLTDLEKILSQMINRKREDLSNKNEIRYRIMSLKDIADTTEAMGNGGNALQDVIKIEAASDHEIENEVWLPNSDVIRNCTEWDGTPSTPTSQTKYPNENRACNTKSNDALTRAKTDLILLQIETLKAESKIRLQVLEKELEEKKRVILRNEEEHALKIQLLELEMHMKGLEY